MPVIDHAEQLDVLAARSVQLPRTLRELRRGSPSAPRGGIFVFTPCMGGCASKRLDQGFRVDMLVQCLTGMADMSFKVVRVLTLGAVASAFSLHASAVTVTVNLGPSAENFVQYGQGPNAAGRGLYAFDQGDCTSAKW